jgi:hypothetical protein
MPRAIRRGFSAITIKRQHNRTPKVQFRTLTRRFDRENLRDTLVEYTKGRAYLGITKIERMRHGRHGPLDQYAERTRSE